MKPQYNHKTGYNITKHNNNLYNGVISYYNYSTVLIYFKRYLYFVLVKKLLSMFSCFDFAHTIFFRVFLTIPTKLKTARLYRSQDEHNLKFQGRPKFKASTV